MIFASGNGFGQAGYALAVTAAAAVCIAAFYRPRIPAGRRTTEISIGRFLRALLSDEGPDHNKPSNA